VVAYCAEPEETTQAIRDWGCHVVAGNCEQQLAAAAADCACGFEEGSACELLAKGWYPFANTRVSAGSRAWMAALPGTIAVRTLGLTLRVIHGSVKAVNRFVFASQRDVIAEELHRVNADIVVAGHSGIPFITQLERGIWFNPGVIGMPANDGSPDVWYGLIAGDGNDALLTTRRLGYDHHAAAAAMRRSAHANGYARTLITGLWPSLDVLPPAELAATGRRIRQRTVRLANVCASASRHPALSSR
jgi:predicted phosphodiesterase